MTHTQGPWKVSYEGTHGKENAKYWIMGGDGLNVVAVLQTGKSEPARGNAQLIAAAPELLEALKLLIDGIGRKDEFKSYSIEDGLAKARIAIAKATLDK